MDGDGWLHNNVNVLNTKNCTLKNSYDGKFCCMYFTTIKKTYFKENE